MGMIKMTEENEFRVCNQCAAKVMTGPVPAGEVFIGKKSWGYFSGKDTRDDEFVLCESCYDKLLSSFAIPAVKRYRNEVI